MGNPRINKFILQRDLDLQSVDPKNILSVQGASVAY